jgi:nucleotide-binding universal stress UspA family protein
MKRFKNILAVVDPARDQDEGLERAADLARENEARLAAIVCLDDALPRGEGDVIRQAIIAGMTERLAALAAPVRERGIEVEIRIVFGEPFLEIIRRVLRAQHDLVVKVAYTAEFDRGFGFASTDLHLLRKCPCPVWMIAGDGGGGGDGGEPRRGVLACVNPVSEDDRGNEVAATILELATSLAIRHGVSCHAVHAWSAPLEQIWAESPWLQLDLADLDELAALAEERHASSFHELVDRFRPLAPDFSAHLRKGDPAAVIIKIAEELKVEVIVMSTIGRTGIAGLFIGNIAETVLSGARCSVLAIKPKGFVSPVTLD